MRYFRKEKELDVTDAEFVSVDDLRRSVKGSIASKIGFTNLRVTTDQVKKLGLGVEFDGYKVVAEDNVQKDKRLKAKEEKRKANEVRP